MRQLKPTLALKQHQVFVTKKLTHVAPDARRKAPSGLLGFYVARSQQSDAKAHGYIARDHRHTRGGDGDVELSEHTRIGKGEIDLRAIRGVVATENERVLRDLLHGELFRGGENVIRRAEQMNGVACERLQTQ